MEVFLTEFTYDFKPTANQDKFIVTQAGIHGQHQRQRCDILVLLPQNLALNGYKFLHDVMWDKTYGGTYWSTGKEM
jgi:mannobiose 2-epimerase